MDASNAINVFDAVDEEEEDRGGWGNKLDFLFSCISVSVGLGSKSKFSDKFLDAKGDHLFKYYVTLFFTFLRPPPSMMTFCDFLCNE